MPQKRIVSIVTRMNVGGPAQLIWDLHNQLSSEVFDHTILTGTVSANETDFFRLHRHQNPPNFIHIPAMRRELHPLDDILALNQIRRILNQIRPDIVHTHTSKAGLLGRLSARLHSSQVKIVHTFHGHVLSGYFSAPFERFVLKAEQGLATVSHRLVAIDGSIQEELVRAGIGNHGKFVVIPPGRDLGGLINQSTARHRLGIESRHFVVSFIGRLTAIKNPDRFLDVAAYLSRKRSDITFLMAGDGELQAHLRNRVDNERLPVIFLGMQPSIEVVLSASDCVLMTSDNEGTPISLIESALASIPIVATDVGAIKSLLMGGEAGYLCQPTVQSLAHSVESALDNESEASSKATRAMENAQRHFSSNASTSQHVKLYEELMA